MSDFTFVAFFVGVSTGMVSHQLALFIGAWLGRRSAAAIRTDIASRFEPGQTITLSDGSTMRVVSTAAPQRGAAR